MFLSMHGRISSEASMFGGIIDSVFIKRLIIFFTTLLQENLHKKNNKLGNERTYLFDKTVLTGTLNEMMKINLQTTTQSKL